MQTYLVFNNKATADSIMQEIAVTPFGQVWCWFDPDKPENAIQYATGADGRCLVCHSFGEEDRDWLEAYTVGMVGVQVLDATPEGWQYPQEEI